MISHDAWNFQIFKIIDLNDTAQSLKLKNDQKMKVPMVKVWLEERAGNPKIPNCQKFCCLDTLTHINMELQSTVVQCAAPP